MKISAERLRLIITEEVIKEELAPEIAAPAIAAMLQGMDPEATSDVFGDAFNQMYGEGALDSEAERQANMEEPEEQEFPTDYQSGGSYGDRPQVGFKESLINIIKEEMVHVLSENENIPDLAKSGPELEKIIRQVLPAIEKATAGNKNLKTLGLQRLFQLLQKEGGVEGLQEELNEVYSDKQRRYMCAMAEDDADRPEGLSQKEAKELCNGPMKKKKKD